MISAGIAHNVDSNAREVLTRTPSAHRDARHDIFDKPVPSKRRFGHRRFNPTRKNRMRGHPVAGVFDCQSFCHRNETAFGGSVMFAFGLARYGCKTRGTYEATKSIAVSSACLHM